MVDYSGFHLGIVVENDDPNYGGRIKVFVPEHMPNLDKIKKWIADGKEITFNSIDKEMSPELVDILDELKECLPWADYAGPIFGGCGNGRFHCPTKTTAINDDKNFGETDAETGYRPLNNYVGSDAPYDDFTRADSSSTLVNKNGGDYEPTNYSGMLRGVFSIPNVGSHVYVFYRGNNPMFPVYFASSYSYDGIQQIYSKSQYTAKDKVATSLSQMHDYPSEFENGNDETDNSKIFRSKTVLNSNKNTIELIDSDGRESIKIQHYGGGFKEFNNDVDIEFAPANDQKLVLGDQFNTIKGNVGLSIGKDGQIKIGGNMTEQVGHYCDVSEALQPLKKKLEDIGKIHQLFAVRRTDYSLTPKDCSPLQKRQAVGLGFTRCPTCGGVSYDPYNSNGLNAGGTYHTDDTLTNTPVTTYIKTLTGSDEVIVTDDSATEKDSLQNPNRMSRQEYGWSRIPKAVYRCVSLFEDKEPFFYSKHSEHAAYGKRGIFGGIKCPTCNNVFWNEGDQTKEWAIDNNEGRSPSTENGTWVTESAKKPAAWQPVLENAMRSTAKIFSELGDQGDKVEKVTMSKVETIGAMFNDLPSYRVDPIGKLRLDGLFVTQQSTVPYYLPTPHVEPVEVPNIPGGDYNLTIGNKWTVSVGSNGIIIQTTGRMEFSGGISEIATQELMLSSKHDMVIDGGERLMLRARKMTINPVEHNALSVDGQLHVLRNEIVRGGLLVEGEVAVQHITAPGELAITGTEMYTGGESEFCPVPVVLHMGFTTEGLTGILDEKTAPDSSTKKPHGGGGQGGHGPPGSGSGSRSARGGTEAKLAAISTAIMKIIEVLQSPIEGTLNMPVHQHAFLQIPTSFKDCPNGVRASLLKADNNINSRQLLLSARRRHHVGAMQTDENVLKIYLKNKKFFDEKVWEALVEGRGALEANLRAKGCTEGCTEILSSSDGKVEATKVDPMCYGMPFGGYSDGDSGILMFYTVRDYFNKTTVPADMIISKSNYVHVKITFKLTGDADNEYSQDDPNPSFNSDSTTPGNLTDAEKEVGYVEETVKATMVGDSDYISKDNPLCVLQFVAWLTKFESMAGL